VAAADDRLAARRLARRVSLGGLLTALILAAVLAAFFSPVADLAFYSLASLGVAIAVIELDWPGALIVYLAAGLLSLAYPGLTAAYPLLVFFGPYPLARAILDMRFRRLPALALRMLAGNLLAALALLLFAWPLTTPFAAKFGSFFWPLLILGGQGVLFLYDYALGLLIQFYMIRFRRR
jgi:hypothetical protein